MENGERHWSDYTADGAAASAAAGSTKPSVL
jgi:hypothetical protein